MMITDGETLRLEDLEACEPDDTETGTDPAEDLAQRQADHARRMDRAGELMQAIQSQLAIGQAPEIILYGALEAIGCLADAAGWTQDCCAVLDAIYGDLEQESLLYSHAAEARDRLTAKTADYISKQRTSATRARNKALDIITAADTLLTYLQDLEDLQPDSSH